MDTENFKRKIIPQQPAMQRAAEQLLGNPEAAADAVQDTVISLWQHRHQIDKVQHYEAYCITLVRNRCIDQLRRQHPNTSLDEAVLLAADAPSCARIEERYQETMRNIRRLPERQQQVLRMKFEEEKDNREIAVSGPIPRPHAEKQAEQTLANLVKEVPLPAAETSATETAAMKTLLTETPAETVQPADTAIVPHTEHNREIYTIQTLIRYAEPEKEEEKTEAVRIFRLFRPNRNLFLRELLTINLSINTHEEQ